MKRLPERLVLAAGAVAIAIGSWSTATARVPRLPHSTGISGYSGQQGVNCNSCHILGIAPTVALSGPAYVLTDSTRTYSFVVSGGQAVAAGLDVSVDGGALVASESGTHLDAGEVTHDSPQFVDGNGDAKWTFDFVAPSNATSVTMYASGNSVDGNGLTLFDQADSTTLLITVVDNLTSFVEFGSSLAGSGGFAPHLLGVDGPSVGPWSIRIEQGLGAASGVLWAGAATKDQFPVFGGHFYVDLSSAPFIGLPIRLDGTAGVAGGGSYDLAGPDISACAPLTVYLQAMFLDVGAIRGIAMTNALQMDVQD